MTILNSTVNQELLSHIIDTIEDQDLTDFDDLHFHAFNEDYYIIGYYQADQWLKKHNISAWEAISDVVEWENNSFGEVNLKPEDINSEKIVNLYVYVLGEDLLNNYDLNQSKEELLSELKSDLVEGGGI